MKKLLVVGIIVLFISMSVLTSVSSKDISISDDKILEDNNKNEPLDTYKEIFTHIDGWCDSVKEKRIGYYIHFDVEICSYDFEITIKGIRFPFNFFNEFVYNIKVPFFIGIIADERSPAVVKGFAIGNIEWS